MRAVIRLSLSALLVVGYLGSLGCGKDEGKPNTNLPTPDVKPAGKEVGGRGDKSPAGKDPGKKF